LNPRFRRVIVKPVDISTKQSNLLAEGLRTAIALQQRLAKDSAHVLTLHGDLQSDERYFFVEHEPATPLLAAPLFTRDLPPIDRKMLSDMLAGVVDALQACHAVRTNATAVHGGLCPAVLLSTADGAIKVSDFGFASAIAEALGERSYQALAVVPTRDHSESEGTATWRVLPPEVTDCDDRICGFIDPEKCGTRMYGSFEPLSDIVSAGVILYLLAHGRHPYFPDDMEAHRFAHVVEFLGMRIPTGAMRLDLLNDDDPSMKRWCHSILRMLDRVPQNRPTAIELAACLSDSSAAPFLTETVNGRSPARGAGLDFKNREPSAIPLRAVKCVGAHAPGLDRLSLVFEDADLPTRLHLFGTTRLRMGRNRINSDVVLRVFPRSSSNDRRTLLISGSCPHIIIGTDSSGLYAEDQGTVNGTALEGQQVNGRVLLPVDQLSRMRVGRVLDLEILPLSQTRRTGGHCLQSYDELGAPGTEWQWATTHSVNALLIRRRDSAEDLESYLAVYRWVDLHQAEGRLTPTCDENIVAACRIVWIGERFWVHALPESPPLSIRGIRLNEGEVVPLAPGSSLACGDVACHVTKLEQYGVWP
jgi:serine/threonine protein kinase